MLNQRGWIEQCDEWGRFYEHVLLKPFYVITICRMTYYDVNSFISLLCSLISSALMIFIMGECGVYYMLQNKKRYTTDTRLCSACLMNDRNYIIIVPSIFWSSSYFKRQNPNNYNGILTWYTGQGGWKVNRHRCPLNNSYINIDNTGRGKKQQKRWTAEYLWRVQ